LVEQGTISYGIQVPYSAGRQKPVIRVPVNACDSHHHIYDPVRFSYIPEDIRNQPPATVDCYRLLQKRLGLTRSVIVTPSAYGTDNRCTLDALRQMGADTRAVVVIDNKIPDAELESMHELGVRGVRFNIATGGSDDCEMIFALSQRIHELGWHVQFWMSANDTVKLEEFLFKIPAPIVFDHRGHIPQPEGTAHQAFKVICKLIDKGKTWVKLSGLYMDTKVAAPTYADTVKVGKAYVAYAPERMVWGTDWPHPSTFSQRQQWPDDAVMLDLLAEQAPDETVRNKILVDNPAVLYGFNK
jgi:D-galactarolactone isomerase